MFPFSLRVHSDGTAAEAFPDAVGYTVGFYLHASPLVYDYSITYIASRADRVAGGDGRRPAESRGSLLSHIFSATAALGVWGARWRGCREQLHQWTAIEQVELEDP